MTGLDLLLAAWASSPCPTDPPGTPAASPLLRGPPRFQDKCGRGSPVAAPARCGTEMLISGPRTLAPGFHRGSRRARQLLASARCGGAGRGASSGGIAPLLLSQPASMLMELTDSGLAFQHSATAAPHLNFSHGNEPSISPASMTTRGESSLTFSRAWLSHRPPPALPPSLALSKCSTFLPPPVNIYFISAP